MVELLIALAIGMFVVAGVATVWVSSRASSRFEADMAWIQENGRFAIETLAHDIRMAGYAGCSDDLSRVSNLLSPQPVSGKLADFSAPIEGRERGGATWQTSSTTWLPSTSTDVADDDILAGTDAITLRYLQGQVYRVTATMTAVSEALAVDRAPGFAANEVVAVSDCSGADLFAVSSATGVGVSITHADLSRLYEGHASKELSFVHPYKAVRYYIGAISKRDEYGNTVQLPALKRVYLSDYASGAETLITETLLEGVDNLQILYGEDTTGDMAADVYRTASAVSTWGNVRTVRIALLVSSLFEHGSEQDSRSYVLLDETRPAFNDRRRRKVFTSVVQVRNNR